MLPFDLLTHTNYIISSVLEYGPAYGIALFATSLVLALRSPARPTRTTRVVAFIIVLATATLTWDYDLKTGFRFGTRTDVDIRVKAGLYYDQSNPLIRTAVEQFWPTELRTYRGTPWMTTGDARTGLPFFFNRVPVIDWKRVFLTVDSDGEVLALDIAFPESGYDPTQPVYMVLHGANGGSQEEYVRDLAFRRTAAGSSVVVMVSRGLMDVPLVTGNIFRADRLSDAHAAATAIRRAMKPSNNQLLAGVGYSMGAIVLSNYVATYGRDCALSVAFAISGALECRYEMDFQRPKRVWQPMITEFSRDRHLSKWGERMKEKLSKQELIGMLRATNVVDLDNFLAVAYYKPRYQDLVHYYAGMGALGDVPLDVLEATRTSAVSSRVRNARISNVSIPLCVLHSFDDPIATWRGIVANDGFMRPETLVRSGQGNVLLLLTERGGHVGWPTGVLPFQHGWEFMSEVAAGFVDAVAKARRHLNDGSQNNRTSTVQASTSKTCPLYGAPLDCATGLRCDWTTHKVFPSPYDISF